MILRLNTITAFFLLSGIAMQAQNDPAKLLLNKVTNSNYDPQIPNPVYDSLGYTYDNQHRQISYIEYLGLHNGTLLAYERGINYSYDSEGHLLGVINQEHSSSAGWYDYSKLARQYDTNGNLTLEEVYTKYPDSSIWNLNNGKYWTYDDQNRPLMRTTDMGYRTNYDYDSQGRLLYETQGKLDSNGVFAPQLRKIYYYTAQYGDLPATIEDRYWSYGLWLPLGRTINEYDPNGNRTYYGYEHRIGTEWKLTSRTFFQYDENDNQTYYLSESLENSGWFTFYKSFATFEAPHYIIQSIFYTQASGTWMWGNTTDYHYTTLLNNKTPDQITFDAFPNPATDVLTIKGANLQHMQIYDTDGKLVFSSDIKNESETTFRLGFLHSGYYSLQVFDKAGARSAKQIIIQ